MTETTILNTRPEFSSQRTAQIFENNGFSVINLPCIAITVTNNPSEIIAKLNKIAANDTLIFTSQHAVTFAYQLYPQLKLTKEHTVITVGTKTAEILEHHSHADIWVPEKQNSRGVIELLRNLKDIQNIKLITAANGREEIQNYAINKLINLEQVNVYQRKLPHVNSDVFKQIEQTNRLVIIATSISIITNLKQLAPKAIWQFLKTQTIACASQRIARQALKQGFENIINTQSANPLQIAQFLSKN